MTVAFADIKDELSTIDSRLYLKKVLFNGLLTEESPTDFTENSYINGLAHGLHKTYYKCGQLKIIALFTRGDKNGRYIEYFECGSKKLNANYLEGNLDGIFEEWDNKGALILRKTFYRGRLIAVKTN